MSALGDYIHLNAKNYLYYGTAQTPKSGESLTSKPNYSTSLVAQRNKNLQNINNLPEINPTTLKSLEGLIQKEATSGYSVAAAKAAAAIKTGYNGGMDKIQDRMEQVISGIVENGLSVEDEATASLAQSYAKKLQGNLSLSLTEEQIQNAIYLRNRINENIRYFNNKTDHTITTDTILTQFKDFFKAIGVNQKTVDEIFPTGTKLTDIGTAEALQMLIKALPFVEGTKTLYQGYFAEALVHAANTSLKKVTIQALYQAIEEGEKRDEIHFEKSRMWSEAAKEYEKIESDAESGIKQGSSLFKVQRTQNKVDATITLEDNTKLQTSIKSYTQGKSGTARTSLQDFGLLYTLSETESEFANHWLNLHCLNLSTDAYDEVLKDTLRYEALVTGNPLKNPKEFVDSFIYISPDLGKIYTGSAKDMLTNNKSNFSITDFSKIPFVRDNRIAETPAARIANILSRVHSTKIHVSYRISSDMMNKLI